MIYRELINNFVDNKTISKGNRYLKAKNIICKNITINDRNVLANVSGNLLTNIII